MVYYDIICPKITSILNKISSFVLLNAGVGIKVTLKPEYRLTPSVCELKPMCYIIFYCISIYPIASIVVYFLTATTFART